MVRGDRLDLAGREDRPDLEGLPLPFRPSHPVRPCRPFLPSRPSLPLAPAARLVPVQLADLFRPEPGIWRSLPNSQASETRLCRPFLGPLQSRPHLRLRRGALATIQLALAKRVLVPRLRSC